MKAYMGMQVQISGILTAARDDAPATSRLGRPNTFWLGAAKQLVVSGIECLFLSCSTRNPITSAISTTLEGRYLQIEQKWTKVQHFLARIHARENNSIYGENGHRPKEWNTRLLLREGFGSWHQPASYYVNTCVPGVKSTTSGFNSRTDSESKTSYTHEPDWQRFRSYEFLKFWKIRKERGALCIYWAILLNVQL